ncbi:PepSY-associated TM helix domain-containing protein [Halalkalibaculum sp. DA3122]|uniref:PepSY-associated TM helix domain-containing protein n=1 Tax=unclassified Halalkalibaculum TaxID=2964617 RepID=UPI0037543009
MPSFKKIMLVIHRWLGLITGLVVLILSITGCLFVFHQEISDIVKSDLYYVKEKPSDRQPLPIEQLEQKAAEALEIEHLPYGLTTYKDPDRNWSAMNYQASDEFAWTYFGSMDDYRTVYINPYTGAVAGIQNEKKDFFQIVKGIHWSLLLATPIGQPIVAWSTVIFIVLLITGIILWWPKKWNKAGRQRSFRIKWGSTWRRVNYDLHNVLGFYFLTLALILAFTGLYWYFPSAKKAIYFLGTGEFKLPPDEHKQHVSAAAPSDEIESPLQVIYRNAWNQNPNAYGISLATPVDSQGTITATVYPDGQTYYEHFHLDYDQYTGELIAGEDYDSKNAGEKLLAMNYDIHVGAIGGLPGKIIAFIASLICGSLPVTGFIIWWDRKKRQWAREKRDRKRSDKSHINPSFKEPEYASPEPEIVNK